MKIPAPRSVVEKSKRAATSAREGVGAAAQSARQGAGTVAETARRGAGTVARSAREGAGAVADSARRGAGAVAETARQGATAVADSARRGAGAARRGASTVSESAGQAAELARGRLADLSTLSVAAIASTLSADLNSALASLAEGPATIYDKAMDAEYLATHIGGGSHRLFDGGHTLWGALRATRDASTEDTLSQEAFGYMQGLFRDGTTPKGLPLANWDKATYDNVSGFLDSNFGIPKAWFYDLNSFDAAEVLGASVGVVSLVLCWNRADAEQFGRLAGGLGLSAALAANPLLIVVAVVAFAKAFHKAKAEGRIADAIDGGARGVMTSGAVLGVVPLVTMAGGPAALALLVGLVVGLVVSKLASNVSASEVARVLAGQMQVAVATGAEWARSAPDRVVGLLPMYAQGRLQGEAP